MSKIKIDVHEDNVTVYNNKKDWCLTILDGKRRLYHQHFDTKPEIIHPEIDRLNKKIGQLESSWSNSEQHIQDMVKNTGIAIAHLLEAKDRIFNEATENSINKALRYLGWDERINYSK